MKTSRVLLIGTLLVILAASFVPAAMVSAEFYGPQAPVAAGYTVDVSGNVLRNGGVLLATRNGVKAVAVSGNDESFSVTFRYNTWQGTRQYYAIYGFAKDGSVFAWNASKSTLVSPALWR